MPQRKGEREDPNGLRARVMSSLAERGLGSPLHVRWVENRMQYGEAPVLVMHRGILVSFSEQIDFNVARGEEQKVIRIDFASQASLRGDLLLLGKNPEKIPKNPDIQPVTLRIPLPITIHSHGGILRFGEVEPASQTHESGMLPLTFVRIAFDVYRTTSSRIKK